VQNATIPCRSCHILHMPMEWMNTFSIAAICYFLSGHLFLKILPFLTITLTPELEVSSCLRTVFIVSFTTYNRGLWSFMVFPGGSSVFTPEYWPCCSFSLQQLMSFSSPFTLIVGLRRLMACIPLLPMLCLSVSFYVQWFGTFIW